MAKSNGTAANEMWLSPEQAIARLGWEADKKSVTRFKNALRNRPELKDATEKRQLLEGFSATGTFVKASAVDAFASALANGSGPKTRAPRSGAKWYRVQLIEATANEINDLLSANGFDAMLTRIPSNATKAKQNAAPTDSETPVGSDEAPVLEFSDSELINA